METNHINRIIKNSATFEEIKNHLNYKSSRKENYIEEWRNVKSLLNDDLFQIMLKHNFLDEEQFSKCLNPEKNMVLEEPFEWVVNFNTIVNKYDFNNIDMNHPTNNIYLPFLNYAKIIAEKTISNIKYIKVSEDILNTFLISLGNQLFEMTGKVFAYELHIYKEHNKDKENLLLNFSRENFGDIDSYINFFEKYPTLLRLLTVRTVNLITSFNEIIERTDSHSNEILTFLESENKVLYLKDIILSSGDSHNNGRSVAILFFKQGKLVYKPKNLYIVKEITNFLKKFTYDFELIDLYFPKGIYENEFCFEEYISYNPCNNEEEIERFYKRYGYLVAFSYIFGVTDLHLENLVAKGEYPVIIDLETIFQNEVILENKYVFNKMMTDLELDSVKGSCLLPRAINFGKEDTVDLGALNGKSKKLKDKFLTPVGINTEDFHYEKIGEGTSPSGNNIPKDIEGNNIDYSNYYHHIINGFIEFISIILNNKKYLLNYLDNLNDYKIRILLKGTERYASMIRISNHPNYNQKMKYRERLLMNIWAYPYEDKRPIISEIKDLLYNDIPFFETTIKSTHIQDSNGKVYESYFEESGLSRVKQRIEHLDKSVIDSQVDIIITELGITDIYLNNDINYIDIKNYPLSTDYLNNSKIVAAELLNKSRKFNNNISFNTLTQKENLEWSIFPVNESLYDGLSGIALLYLELYIKTKLSKYYDIYLQLQSSAIEQAELLPISNAFQGKLSPLYSLIIEKKYLGSISFPDYLKKLTKQLKTLTAKDISLIKDFDFISGIAGIIVLLKHASEILGKEFINEEIINIFIEHGKMILDKSNKEVGVAHGLSGLIYSLAVNESISVSTANKLLKEELQYLNSNSDIDKLKWCKGVPGMIQVRLSLLSKNKDYVDTEDLKKLTTIFKKNLKLLLNNDCLCHGNSGILITLDLLSKTYPEEEWSDILNKGFSNITYNALHHDYNIQHLKYYEYIGLFTGKAGISWASLYLSGNTPNVLLLEI
ncbi:type 2 lantipeptide synthetase LanM (plasmid) [Macrococcoides canis]|uniref:type 2 lanthipeptide synthetase LanM n=1 Tax=Macrococcoides canis TaxID=1855823 RepID=UPI001EEC5330|nr:type 2 lanthipeptide synthetase LanM [Macrococcus canis]UJS29015.1 type 2 lantipeptide synthetase LanM [Macrococcus canis]